MNLWVDDIRPAPEGWTLAKTVTEAIRVLATQKVSEVSLDHDISHSIFFNGIHRPYPCGETFEPVAHYLHLLACAWENHELYQDAKQPPESVNIHTANPVAAKKMSEILSRHYKVTITLGKPCNRFEGEA